MSLAGPSNYKTLRIDKSLVKQGVFAQAIDTSDIDSYETKTAQLEGKTIRFDYFESIYSPMITANTTIVDTGESATDKRDNLATIRDGFPIVGDGTEFITFEISNANGTLTSKQPMVVTGAPITLDQVKLLQKDNVVLENVKGFHDLGIKPMSIYVMVEKYLKRYITSY